MRFDIILKPGNEVRVKSDHGNYISSIDEVTEHDVIKILEPRDRTTRLLVKPGEKYSITCVNESGLFMFETQVSGVDHSNKVVIVELKTVGECTRIQRRQAFRTREKIDISVRKKPEESELGDWVKTTTVDISELGTLIRYSQACEIGQDMELILRINKFGINTVLPIITGKVVRCMETRNKELPYLVGVRFDELAEKTRRLILRLVVLSQRDKLSYGQAKEFGRHGDRGLK